MKAKAKKHRGFKAVQKAKAFVDNTVKSMQSVGPKRNKDGVPMRKLK